jgi:HPr kinase/phosphorylase
MRRAAEVISWRNNIMGHDADTPSRRRQEDGWAMPAGEGIQAPESGFRYGPVLCMVRAMQIHASCAARDTVGVLLTGPPGSGKSDLLLRLIDRGFMLVADDRVDIEDGIASPPAVLAGLIEVRGLGILCLPHLPRARLALAVELGGSAARLPVPTRHPTLGVPSIALDAFAASAAQRVALALDCAEGHLRQQAGAFVVEPPTP